MFGGRNPERSDGRVRPQPASQSRALQFDMEVSGYLVGSAAFKAVGTSDPRPAGSIPVHLRQHLPGHSLTCEAGALSWGFAKQGSPASGHVRGALLSR